MSTWLSYNEDAIENGLDINNLNPECQWMCGLCDDKPKFQTITELFDHKVQIHISSSVAIKTEVFEVNLSPKESLINESAKNLYVNSTSDCSDDDEEDNVPLSALQKTASLSNHNRIPEKGPKLRKSRRIRSNVTANSSAAPKEIILEIIEQAVKPVNELRVDEIRDELCDDGTSSIDDPPSPKSKPEDVLNDEIETSKPLSCKICYQEFSSRKNLTEHKGNCIMYFVIVIVLVTLLGRYHLLCNSRLVSKCLFSSVDPSRVESTLNVNFHRKEISWQITGHCFVAGIHKCPETGKYKCSTCGKLCPKYDNFLRHIIIHQENRPRSFYCDVCMAGFYNQADLKRHSMLHMDVKPYTCEHCKEGFVRQEALLSHYSKHTGVPYLKYVCRECGKILKSPSALAMHCKQHTKKSVFCPEEGCTFSCYLKSQLRQHIKIHSGEKPYQCAECGRCFGRSNDMKNHVLNVHQRFRPHKCPECPKEFTLASSLKAHRQAHINIRPYLCAECGKGFNHPSTLRKHCLFLHSEVSFAKRKHQVQIKDDFEETKYTMTAAVETAYSNVQPSVSVPGLSVPVTIHIPNITIGMEQSFANAFVISTVSLPPHTSGHIKLEDTDMLK